MKREVYLDNSATTRISDAALNKYIEVSRECYGNPSSLHTLGFRAEKLLDAARAEIALSLNTNGANVIFTSSGSEANNLAIFGRAFARERFRRGAKIITTDGEHASVGEPLKRLSELGYEIATIPTQKGELDLDALRREMTKNVVLVTMMLVNNETGAIYDTQTVKKIMRASAPDALLHIDATQAYLKMPMTMTSVGADMMTISSHKIEGPKGVGALVLMPELIKAKAITPITLGGGQESGYRSGTENVPAIAAFGEAVRLGRALIQERYTYLSELNGYLLERLNEDCPEVSVTLPKRKIPNIVNITLPKIKSETMLHHLSSFGVYVSSGSACSSNAKHTSSALTAFGRSADEADSSLRISLSHTNTREDIDALIEALALGISKLSRKK